MFHEGEQIKIQCDFDNTTSGNLTFGPEMCLFFTGTVDTAGNGNLDCDQGVWSPY